MSAPGPKPSPVERPLSKLMGVDVAGMNDGHGLGCPFHATGGHPDDRHGFDPASVVYGVAAPPRDVVPGEASLQLLLAQEPRP